MRAIRILTWVLPVAAAIPSSAPLSKDHTAQFAKATLRSCADGTTFVGTAVLRERPSSQALKTVDVFIAVQGLDPGNHAVHIHATGSCATTTAACDGAGSHLDLGPFPNNSPVTANHPYHSGDLVNIGVGSDGKGILSTVTTRIALSPDTGRDADRGLSIFDANGSSIIIHALPDTYCPTAADPTCAGGGRAACGVWQRIN